MPVISEFILNLVNPDYSALRTQGGDLVIIESGSDSQGGTTLSTSEVEGLQNQGRTVIAYLNVAVTDHNRTYWNDAWVDYSDPANRDVGPLNPGVPDWLANNHGSATDGATTFGYIVDYTDPAWQQRVIDEAVRLVTPVAQGGLGYDGVFLDDVGRYFQAAANDPSYSTEQAAQDMMAFVVEIAAAVRAVNPDAYIAINGGAYIADDSLQPTDPATLAFFDAVDALMMESEHTAFTAWDYVLNNPSWNSGRDLLAVEHATNSSLDPRDFSDWARAFGVVPHVAPDNAYDSPAVTPGPGSTGRDLIEGGDGPNRIDALAGDDTIRAGAGHDTVLGGNGNDLIFAGGWRDRVFGGSGDDTIRGQAGSDTLLGNDGNDLVVGNRGDDLAIGGNGADLLLGLEGNDILRGGAGNDTALGGAGNDTLEGGAGDDILRGGNGNDLLRGGADNDSLAGGQGNDTALGGLGNDTVEGFAGNDTLNGGAGNDVLRGGLDNDSLSGDQGNDTLNGGVGNDTLNGGAGVDAFVFSTGTIGTDVVEDFVLGEDRLRLDDALWGGGLTPAQVLSQFGDDSSGVLILDFGGGNTVTLTDITTASGFEAAIDIF